MQAVQRMLGQARMVEGSGLDASGVLARQAEARFERRRALLRSGAGLGALLLSERLLAGCGGGGGGDAADAGTGGSGGGGAGGSGGESAPTVAVIGAGLAGLHCAWRLQQAGVGVRVFDAANRTGGRIHSTREAFSDGLVAELGAELIDAEHVTMHTLADEFGLSMDDLFENEPAGQIRASYSFGGRFLTDAEVVDALRPVAGKLVGSVLTAYPDGLSGAPDANEFARLDAMNLADYLEREIFADRLATSILRMAALSEFGREPEDLSAWNLLWLIDPDAPEDFTIFGDDEERYRLRGGNDTLVAALAGALSTPPSLEHRLVGLKRRSDGRVEVRLDQNGTPLAPVFEQVVLALPYTQLRKLPAADLTALVDAEEARIIRELGYGLHTKFMMGFRSRVWAVDHGRSGTTLTDSGSQTFWDTARGQESLLGLLTNYVGGDRALALGDGTPESQVAAVLAELEPMYPGVTEAYFPNSAVRMHWPTVPTMEGSFACFTPGQAVFSGRIGRPAGEGAVFFAGEHVSEEMQGYMEGAAESGAAAAAAVLEARGMPLAEAHTALRSRVAARRGRRR
jgi:monoamine oxidase